MVGRKDIAKDGVGTRFSSTNQPAHPGRKPSLYNHIRKLLGSDVVAGRDLSKKTRYFCFSRE